MGAKREQGGVKAIEPAREQRQWLQLQNESAQAFAGFRSYLDLPRGERTIAKAYRALKGDDKARAPGYFSAWASKFKWRDRAEQWELYLDSLTAIVNAEELTEARRQTAEVSADLMRHIAHEVRRFESAPAMSGMGTEDRVRIQHAKADALARLAAALKDAAQARIAALDDGDRQRMQDGQPLEVRLLMTPND